MDDAAAADAPAPAAELLPARHAPRHQATGRAETAPAPRGRERERDRGERDRGGRRREEEHAGPAVTGFGSDIPAFMLLRTRASRPMIAEEPEIEA